MGLQEDLVVQRRPNTETGTGAVVALAGLTLLGCAKGPSQDPDSTYGIVHPYAEELPALHNRASDLLEIDSTSGELEFKDAGRFAELEGIYQRIFNIPPHYHFEITRVDSNPQERMIGARISNAFAEVPPSAEKLFIDLYARGDGSFVNLGGATFIDPTLADTLRPGYIDEPPLGTLSDIPAVIDAAFRTAESLRARAVLEDQELKLRRLDIKAEEYGMEPGDPFLGVRIKYSERYPSTLEANYWVPVSIKGEMDVANLVDHDLKFFREILTTLGHIPNAKIYVAPSDKTAGMIETAQVTIKCGDNPESPECFRFRALEGEDGTLKFALGDVELTPDAMASIVIHALKESADAHRRIWSVAVKQGESAAAEREVLMLSAPEKEFAYFTESPKVTAFTVDHVGVITYTEDLNCGQAQCFAKSYDPDSDSWKEVPFREFTEYGPSNFSAHFQTSRGKLSMNLSYPECMVFTGPQMLYDSADYPREVTLADAELAVFGGDAMYPLGAW